MCYVLCAICCVHMMFFLSRSMQSFMVWPLINFPYTLSVFMQARVSSNRITDFLLLPELTPNRPLSDALPADLAVRLRGCSFAWRRFNAGSKDPPSSSHEKKEKVASRTGAHSSFAGESAVEDDSSLDIELTELLEDEDQADRPLLAAQKSTVSDATLSTVLHDIALDIRKGWSSSCVVLDM